MFLQVLLVSCYHIVWMEKNVFMFAYVFKKSFWFECQKKKNAFEIRHTQYSIELSVHKQPKVFNTTYTIQSRVDWPNVWKLALSWWRRIRLRRLVYVISWKTTGKQMVVFYDCDMSSFFEKTGDHLLGSASCASKFCWIWLILKHLYSRLLFTFGLIYVNLRFIVCANVIDVFRSTAIVFLEHFFWPIDTSSFFLSDWQIVWHPTRTNFFYRQMFIQYWM